MNPSSEGLLSADGSQGPPRSLGEASDFVGISDLHYVEWSRGGAELDPPILLLHGLGSNARYWDRVAAHLEDRRLVALDLTPADPDRAGIERLLTGIALAIRGLDLGRPVVVGHSWGAGLALELVAQSPELASGLVFVDGPIDGVARIFDWEHVEAFMQPPFPRYATLEDAVAVTKTELGTAWGDELRPFVQAGLRRDGDAFVSTLTTSVRHRLLRDLYDSDPEKLWPSLKMPASALIARKSDARISRSTDLGLHRVAEIAPSVRIVRFETPHDIPLYDPAGVAAEIERVAISAGEEPVASASSSR